VINDPNFTLDLGPRWLTQATADPQQYRFTDEARDITMTLSSGAHRLDPDAVAPFAADLARRRVAAESEAAGAAGRTILIYEPIVVPQRWGESIAYYGHDSSGRRFSFAGTVTATTLIGLYMESGRLTEGALARAMDTVLSHIDFDQTPIRPRIPYS
jgi:hypothetical protein